MLTDFEQIKKTICYFTNFKQAKKINSCFVNIEQVKKTNSRFAEILCGDFSTVWRFLLQSTM